MSEFDKKQIFVGNLSPKTTIASLSAAFSRYGNVVQAHVQPEKSCGFVTFANEASVTNLLTNVMAGTLTVVVDGIWVTPKPKVLKNKNPQNSISQSPDLNPKEIFVGGLTPSTTSDDVKNYFSKWGLITSSRLLQQKNVAFVMFKHASDAQQLLMKTMNGQVHFIKNKAVTVQPVNSPTGKKDGQATKMETKSQPTKAKPNEKRNHAPKQPKPKQDKDELTALKSKCYELQQENEKLKNEKKSLQTKSANTEKQLKQEVALLKQKLKLAESNVENLIMQQTK